MRITIALLGTLITLIEVTAVQPAHADPVSMVCAIWQQVRRHQLLFRHV